MAADVGHGPHLTVTVTQHDDGLSGEGQGQKVAGVWQCLGPACTDPLQAGPKAL